MLHPRDGVRPRALIAAKVLESDPSVSFLTTEAVLVELLTHMSGYGGHARGLTVQLVERLFSDRRLTVVPSNRELFDAALELYRRRPDKSYSMTDCISMVVCRDEGVEEVLTADKDFEQEGFTILL